MVRGYTPTSRWRSNPDWGRHTDWCNLKNTTGRFVAKRKPHVPRTLTKGYERQHTTEERSGQEKPSVRSKQSISLSAQLAGAALRPCSPSRWESRASSCAPPCLGEALP